MSLRGLCTAFPPLGSRCKLETYPVNPPQHPTQQWGYLGCTARGSLGMRMGLVSARCRLRLATSRLRRRRAARGGAGCAAGHRRPQALLAGWRRGGRGRWRVLMGRGAPAEDRGARRAGLEERSSGTARGGGRGGAFWGGLGAGRGRGPEEGGAVARGGLWRPQSHTRGGSGGGGICRGRRRRDGHGRAGSGGRRLPPSVACSLAASPGSPQRSRKGRRGPEDADKFSQQPQIPAKAEVAAPTGQQRAALRSARPERPRRGRPGLLLSARPWAGIP